MELPKPPEDQELRNIIDKLAQFVARNGPEFEQMTKNKQRDNPKFGFLYGGDYFNYYQYKVNTEQAILKQKAKANDHSPRIALPAAGVLPAGNGIGPPTLNTMVSTLGGGPPSVGATTGGGSSWQQQHAQLREQMLESEHNLLAQHQVLVQQQQVQVDEAVRNAQDEQIRMLAKAAGLNLGELEMVLEPIIHSCTKDAISAGKGWIFNHAITPPGNEVISRFLLRKVTATGASFDLKLHLVYLINDVLHHCMRKNASDLRNALESVVVPIFCTTSVAASDDQQLKLAKLLKLWEANHYFEDKILEQLKNPKQALAAFQAQLVSEFSSVIAPITNSIQNQYSALQKQHQDFVSHIQGQLQMISQHLPPSGLDIPPGVGSSIVNGLPTSNANDAVFGGASLNSNEGPSGNWSHPNASFSHAPPPLPATSGAIPSLSFSQPPPGFPYNPSGPPDFSLPPPSMGVPPFNPSMPNSAAFPPPLPNSQGVDIPGLPDLSKPPPGFPVLGAPPHTPPPPPIPEASMIPPPRVEPQLMPSVPYYELPAGLMVPLVKLEDDEYQPLDPDLIRLPPPQPPSERLLAAVNMFYEPPSHDRPRNSEGWEQLGLYEFFKAKSQAKKKKEEEIRTGTRKQSPKRSESPQTPDESNFYENQPYEIDARPPTPPPRRRYREEREETPRMEELPPPPPPPPVRRRSRSRSRSRSPQRSPRRPPPPAPRRRSRSRSPLPYIRSSRSRSRSRSRTRSRSPSPQRPAAKESPPEARSPTPPSFFGSTYSQGIQQKLDESNKGHMLLKKMGWGGAGLGATEQGIQEPISGGEIRDRQDQFKGIGISLNDPFETFRKSRGQLFISRMKARAEEIAKAGGTQ